MRANEAAVMRLRAMVEAEPSALVRVLQQLQARNLVPLRVCASRLGSDLMEIEVELSGLASCTLQSLAAKIGQMPFAFIVMVCD